MKLDQHVAARKSIPLTEQDLHDLALLRSSAEHRAILAEELETDNLRETSSEAAYLSALVKIAFRQVREVAEERGYAVMAQESEGDLTAKQKRKVARRRPPSGWANE